MKLNPVTEVEFERLLARVSTDTYRAADYWRLVRGLDLAVENYGREFSQHETFWGFTFSALRDVTLSHLGRLYDKTQGTLSLERFLRTAKACSEYFSEQSFRSRQQDNPNVESLATATRTLDLPTLEAEIVSVSDRDPLVKKLIHVRNKLVAHRDAEMVRLATLSSITGLTANEVDTLLERAIEITSKYNLLYHARFMSREVTGAYDYKDLLCLVKRSLDVVVAAHEEDYRRAKEFAHAQGK